MKVVAETVTRQKLSDVDIAVLNLVGKKPGTGEIYFIRDTLGGSRGKFTYTEVDNSVRTLVDIGLISVDKTNGGLGISSLTPE